MTGRPQREQPKQTCRLAVGEDVLRSIKPLLKTDGVEFASLSQLVETILFLSEHIYVAEPDDAFVIGLARQKSDRVIAQIEDPALCAFKYIHVTLDEKAIAFMDLLIRKYPMLFRTRSDAAELLLLNVGNACSGPNETRYYANRLAEVLRMHPTHSDRA